ncbi:MAG TPA: hypothetical protein VH108_05450, partial [Gaiellaceae bacterium]|nr:hypothetical protein [Gaiellaceae bacterium]
MSDELDRIRRRHRKRRRLTQQRILAAVLALASVTALLVALQPRFSGGTSSKTTSAATRPRTRPRPGRGGKRLAVLPPGPSASRDSAVPILMYHVINPAPRDARFPGLFVAPAQFTAQMNALAAAGFRAVTLDQIAKTWLTRAPLPHG